MPDNNDELIDSREICERIEDLQNDIGDNDHADDFVAEREELAELLRLAEQGEQFEDWNFGVTLIRFDYFEQYAQDYYEDVFDIPDNLLSYIDWERVASDLQMDYRSLDFEGVEYWARD